MWKILSKKFTNFVYISKDAHYVNVCQNCYFTQLRIRIKDDPRSNHMLLSYSY